MYTDYPAKATGTQFRSFADYQHYIHGCKYDELSSLVPLLSNPNLKDSVLARLSTMGMYYNQLVGEYLWNFPQCIDLLIQEVILVYPVLSCPTLMQEDDITLAMQSLSLLHKVICQPCARMSSFVGDLLHYLYPFLSMKYNKEGPIEQLQVSSLMIVAHLVKVPDVVVKDFLRSTALVHVCLTMMSEGGITAKSIATLALGRMLKHDFYETWGSTIVYGNVSLPHVVGLLERMFYVPKRGLVEVSFGCYLFLTRYPEACDELRRRIPNILKASFLMRYLSIYSSPLFSVTCLENLLQDLGILKLMVE